MERRLLGLFQICTTVCLMVMLCIPFQSQQARLATLYLPLFGLLQENVHRLNVKESAHLSNHNVSLTPSGGRLNGSLYLQFPASVRLIRTAECTTFLRVFKLMLIFQCILSVVVFPEFEGGLSGAKLHCDSSETWQLH